MSATQPLIETYNSYEKQHDAFVAHAKSTIVVLKAQIKTIEELIESAEKQKLLQLERKPEPAITEEWEPEEKRSNSETDYESGAGREKPRSSRWDAAGDPSVPGTLPPPAPPGIWNEGPTLFRPQDDHPAAFVQPHALPDLSRPPPGFAGPPPGMIMAFDEKQLIPTLAYYDLPAGLMVPLIPLDEFGYKPIDPKQIRLPRPIPPTAAMLAALEQFYAPPSHERPRDPDGWEMLGLYEWSKDKTAAVKAKADAIESGRRERSPTASPDPYLSGGSTPEPQMRSKSSMLTVDDVKPIEQPVKRKRYTSRSRSRSKSRDRTRSRSRTRSRTRSRSRESTPEYGSARRRKDSKRQHSESRSPSPPSFAARDQYYETFLLTLNRSLI